jgi:hypothetical protein
MGFKTEFNWVLKLPDLDKLVLEVGNEYEFTKSENRIYPINRPIDLIDDRWNAIARIKISEVKYTQDSTLGKYSIMKIYSDSEKEFLTKYWRETVEILK